MAICRAHVCSMEGQDDRWRQSGCPVWTSRRHRIPKRCQLLGCSTAPGLQKLSPNEFFVASLRAHISALRSEHGLDNATPETRLIIWGTLQ